MSATEKTERPLYARRQRSGREDGDGLRGILCGEAAIGVGIDEIGPLFRQEVECVVEDDISTGVGVGLGVGVEPLVYLHSTVEHVAGHDDGGYIQQCARHVAACP